MSSSSTLLALIQITLLFTGLRLFAQTNVKHDGSTNDAAWVRDFASPSSATQRGRENALNGDPRFRSLLQSSLRQHQNFWRDRGQFTPVAELAQNFIGVPGSVLLDQEQYVTADGCVPHDCGDRGMVWIDTSAQPATVIFVATVLITGRSDDTAGKHHLWLFSSAQLNGQTMSQNLVSSLERWSSNNRAKGYVERIALVTLVQPNGQMVDLSPSIFSL